MRSEGDEMQALCRPDVPRGGGRALLPGLWRANVRLDGRLPGPTARGHGAPGRERDAAPVGHARRRGDTETGRRGDVGRDAEMKRCRDAVTCFASRSFAV